VGVVAVVVQDFDSALAFVLLAEGGFSNVQGDHGGPTSRGITQATYSAWLSSLGMHDAPVAGISAEYVEAVYLENFWKAGGCDRLPSPLNLVHFDSVVQHVPAAWSGMLASATAFQGAAPETEAFALLTLRDNLYRRIIAKDPMQRKFLKGWMNRLIHLRTAAGL
jgi:lysozyme family protein